MEDIEFVWWVVGGWWWSKVIFVSNPTFELSCGCDKNYTLSQVFKSQGSHFTIIQGFPIIKLVFFFIGAVTLSWHLTNSKKGLFKFKEHQSLGAIVHFHSSFNSIMDYINLHGPKPNHLIFSKRLRDGKTEARVLIKHEWVSGKTC